MQCDRPPPIIILLILIPIILMGLVHSAQTDKPEYNGRIIKIVDVPNQLMVRSGFPETSHIGWQLKQTNLFTPWTYSVDGRWVVYGHIVKNKKKRLLIEEINYYQAREFAEVSNKTIEPIPEISWFQIFYPLIFVWIGLCVLACLSFILKSQVPPPYNKNTLYAFLHPILISDEWKWFQNQIKKGSHNK